VHGCSYSDFSCGHYIGTDVIHLYDGQNGVSNGFAGAHSAKVINTDEKEKCKEDCK
jgi:hypothetical protein